MLRYRVERRGRLIQYYHRRRACKGACQGYLLLFADRKIGAVIVEFTRERCFDAVLEPRYALIGSAFAQRMLDKLRVSLGIRKSTLSATDIENILKS